MKILIESTPKFFNPDQIEEFTQIIKAANIREPLVNADYNIRQLKPEYFFIYSTSSHIAIHFRDEEGTIVKERFLFITE